MAQSRHGTPASGKAGNRASIRTPHTGCALSDLFHVLGKAHMLDILHALTSEGTGPMRFVDLQSRLGVSPNTLSERLRDLVQAGLLTRTAYNEIPPRVDYQATEKALELGSVFEELQAWATKHSLKPEPRPVAVTA